ncbi:universal stress protein [Thermohalobacter berrensis]|uniref:UspA domain-containing protein n=1 Tax=Thermohalobacter berrensis TaxID=99594 RepID=A0A419T7M3_9FIRM|nr:universal stress protein [Thermohalobacter berrensis]RKD33471.1 hypothetical protein BET03_09475 [Thermohalobacter berrensis]
MKKILLPVDGSEACLKSYAIARDFAQKFEAEITVVNIQQRDLYFSPYDGTNLQARSEDFMAVGNQIVEKAKEFFRDSGVKILCRVEFGNPAKKIIEIAESEDFDMIIMCTHGMSAVKRFTLGSVTNKVVHHAKKPVLVVR